MTTNNSTIPVNDTLAVFLEDGQISIGREDVGLVTVQIDELRPLVDTIARALVSPWSTPDEMDTAAYVNALNYATHELTKLRASHAQGMALLAEELDAEKQQLQDRAQIWKQAAKENREAKNWYRAAYTILCTKLGVKGSAKRDAAAVTAAGEGESGRRPRRV